jgi:hypothetical protein
MVSWDLMDYVDLPMPAVPTSMKRKYYSLGRSLRYDMERQLDHRKVTIK